MHYLILITRRFFNTIRRENIDKVIIVMTLVVIAGSCALAYFEDKLEFQDALWWSFVTMTTVGYGDIYPATPGGRLVAIMVMLLGIGILGVFTATIASIFIENRFQENKGMKSTCVSGHFIICGWNYRGAEIVAELRADAKSCNQGVVLIADLPEKPLEDPAFHFIRGEVTKETLQKANLTEAGSVIVLNDDRLDAYAGDAKSILNTMTIKNFYPAVYTCVELMSTKNVEQCRMAQADEIIITGEISTNLLVQAALDHGITRMVSELVSNRHGNELFKIAVPAELIGQTFWQALCELKKNKNILCLGVEDKAGKDLVSNPDNDYQLSKDDRLIVIAQDRPSLS